MSEIFPWPAAEVPSDPREQLRTDCLRTIEAGITDLRTAYFTGEDDLGVYYSHLTARLLCDFAHLALEANATGRFDTYLRMLEEFNAGAYGFTAEVCLTGIAHGHERSRTVLEQGLAQEKERNQEHMGFKHYISPNTLIGRIMHHHAEKELPVDEWIDRFAISQRHGWNLRTTYLSERIKNYPDNKQYQAEFDKAIASTMGQPFALGFKAFRLARDFAKMKDPRARGKLFSEYAEAIHDPTDHEDLTDLARTYLSMATTILTDPELATPALVRYLKNYTEVSMKTQWQASASELTPDYLEWKLHLADHHGATPEARLRLMDEELNGMLGLQSSAGVLPEDIEKYKIADTAVSVRDVKLADWATQFAEKGDFAAARLYLSHIGDQVSQEVGTETCLEFARSHEDVEMLKPDTLALDFNPMLALHFKIAEAVHSQNLDRIMAVGIELAEKGKDDWSETGYYVAHTMYEKVSQINQEAALVLAKTILPIFRQNNLLEYTYLELPSLDLIRSGDLEEAVAARQHIEAVPSASLQRLDDLRKVAEALKG